VTVPERPPHAASRRRAGRLSRSAEFDRVYRQGRSLGNRYLVLYCFPRAGEQESRLGLSVSRKVGGAVDRNRVKRLLREAFARESDGVAAGHDVVIVARPEARELAEQGGLEAVASTLRELLDRAGMAEATQS
jgi:ribonuclease P protein component